MAEAAVFSIATRLLSTIGSPAFEKAYEKATSIWEAREELDNLRETIRMIQAVLLDAEKKQESSATVKEWIKRVRNVLYEADDLFDEVATNDLLQQQIKGNKLWRKVRVSCSPLNPIIFRTSIAKKVEAVRSNLLRISGDMDHFGFERSSGGEATIGTGRRVNAGSSVDPNEVLGRDDDKNAILEFLFNESNVEQNISVIAIVGIGGMGKTTLTQLVYNDEEVQTKFEKKWWAFISDVDEEKEVIGRVFHSITGENYHDLDVDKLKSGIRKSMSEDRKFILVLDDVWDDNHSRWLNRMSLLSGAARGSKIIVTTRSSSVADAVGAAHTRMLDGLSEEMSWRLFKRLAFRPGQAEDQTRERIGKEILQKYGHVPLAITAIANVLYTKNSITEWKCLKDTEISQIEENEDGIMFALKLSYNHLPSKLKHCFAYCSLFPKDYRIVKEQLIQLWISQGYVHLESSNGSQPLEDVGHMYFMELLRRSFFQGVEKSSSGEIFSCKMHDLVHDLAKLVAGEETAGLMRQTNQFNGPIRHLAIQQDIDDLPTLPHFMQLRSLLMFGRSLDLSTLDQRITKFRFLRALDLKRSGINEVSSSTRELIHLRYLNLSINYFRYLPNSVTKLLNLITLDISWCMELQLLPNDFRKLISLKRLYNKGCYSLRHMPPKFEEMTCLQFLDCFKADKAIDCSKSGRLNTLVGLKLRGELEIKYEDGIDDSGEDSISLDFKELEQLKFSNYPGMRISFLPTNLVSLALYFCRRVKHLPTFRHFPHLKKLDLYQLDELEYVEEEGEKNTGGQGAAGSNSLFFPCFEELELEDLPKLKGWSRKCTAADQEEEEEHYDSTGSLPPPQHQMPSFPLLSHLDIKICPEVKSMPLSPRLENLSLMNVKEGDVIEQQLASSSSLRSIKIWHSDGLVSFTGEALTSLQHLEIQSCYKLKKLCLPPAQLNVLEKLDIAYCPELESFLGKALTSLQNLEITNCNKLKEVYMPPAHLNVLEKLDIAYCPELESFLGQALTSLQNLEITNCNKLKEVYLPPAHLNVLENLEIKECPELENFFGEALTFLRNLGIEDCSKLKKVYLPPVDPNVLEKLYIADCPELESILGEALTSLHNLYIRNCKKLKNVYLPPKQYNVLEKLWIRECAELELWEEKKRGVDWDSLPNLSYLILDEMPKPERLPDCLQQRKALGKLQII